MICLKQQQQVLSKMLSIMTLFYVVPTVNLLCSVIKTNTQIHLHYITSQPMPAVVSLAVGLHGEEGEAVPCIP